jgi:hypothetical protein
MGVRRTAEHGNGLLGGPGVVLIGVRVLVGDLLAELDALVQRFLLKLRQNHGDPRLAFAVLALVRVVRAPVDRQHLVTALVVDHGQHEVARVVAALGNSSLLAHGAHGGHQHAHQNGNNRHHRQQLDQGETKLRFAANHEIFSLARRSGRAIAAHP